MRSAASTTVMQKYSIQAMTLHWLMALLIIWAFAIGWIVDEFPQLIADRGKYMGWHKWIGVTVFALALLRLSERILHRAPPLPATTVRWERAASHLVHGLLYVLMFAVPLSGYFYSAAAGRQVIYLGLVPLPMFIEPNAALKPVFKSIHIFLNYTLLSLFALHILAALKHQFINRDSVFARMVPFLKGTKPRGQDASKL